MRISLLSHLSPEVSLFSDRAWTALTDQQKRVLAVAAVAFTLLAACYAIYLGVKRWKAHPIEEIEEVEELDEPAEPLHKKILENIYLYRGSKGDYLLNIDVCFSTRDERDTINKLFGEKNGPHLPKYPAHLWSGDGVNFHVMAFESYKAGKLGFATEEDDPTSHITLVGSSYIMRAGGKDTEIQVLNPKQQVIAKYEPENDKSLKQLLQKFKTGKANIIPHQAASKPVNIFSIENKADEYILITFNKGVINKATEESGDRVYMGKSGSLKEYEIKEIAMAKDGGTTTIKLKDGSSIYFPAADKRTKGSSHFTSAQGERFTLIEHSTKTFDYASIGFQLEPNHHYPTMLDIYPSPDES